jgi:hypothetical protein
MTQETPLVSHFPKARWEAALDFALGVFAGGTGGTAGVMACKTQK